MSTIEDQLSNLRFHGMYARWKAMVETREHHGLSFNDGLEVLLQAEAQDRANRRFERLTKAARFRYQATIEELNLESTRGINRSQVTELATGTYLDQGEGILITGATGTGKSFLASALGHRASVPREKRYCILIPRNC